MKRTQIQSALVCSILAGLLLPGCDNKQNKPDGQITTSPSESKLVLLKDPSKVKVVYPETKQISHVDNYFGTEVADPYRWLEDEGKDNPEAYEAWLDAQAKLADNYLRAIPQREALRKRLTEVFDYERYSTPFKEAGQYYVYKNTGLQNQSVLYRLKGGLQGEEEVLLDPNTLAADGTTSLNSAVFSRDGKYLAYSVSEGGSDWQTIRVRDLGNGQDLPDKIEWVRYSGLSWYKDGFFYSRFPTPDEGSKYTSQNLFQQVYYHKIGTPQSEDRMVFADRGNPNRMFGAGVTEDEKLLLIYTSETTSGNGLMYKNLDKGPEAEFEPLIEGFEHDYTVVDYENNKLLVLTNKEADNLRLVEIDLAKPEPKNWKNIIGASAERVINSVSAIGGYLLVVSTKDVKQEIALHERNGKLIKFFDLPEAGSISGPTGRKADKESFITFTSFTRPYSIYRIDLEKKEMALWKEGQVKGFDANSYETKQVFYASKDGTKVPMYLIHKKGLKLDGKNPTLLYGYGGFNVSIMPGFSSTRIPFLENGGIYAVANIRGGGEYGKAWHEAGTLLKKQNVFDDFIAAAEYLIAQKYTSSEKLAIEGRSNGGLLVGACMTQRPELFAVALPGVGVLDMLRFQNFTVGRAWTTDYGSSEDSTQFKYLRQYSPLHNVKASKYPATLISTADRDDRVVPAHSFKFAAELQAKQQGQAPILLRLDRKAGHGAGKPTDKRILEEADKWGFVFFHLRMN